MADISLSRHLLCRWYSPIFPYFNDFGKTEQEMSEKKQRHVIDMTGLKH